MVYNRIAYDETYRKIGQNPRESWRMVPDSHPAIISWELFDEVSALREAEEYVDDGYSGTSTSRPAFQRLIQDAQDGKVKTIIVKDFSRFARD